MTYRVRKLNRSAALLLGAAVLLTVAVPLESQSPAPQSPPAQSPTAQAPTNDWQKAAGGKQSFDVASVKQNTSQNGTTNEAVSLNVSAAPGDVFTPTGGLFSGTNVLLVSYIVFAYKLTGNQVQLLFPQLPKWVFDAHFDIQARAAGNPTKNQLRMMMQSLLEDRFKLASHYETRQLPVFAAELAKPGITGPQLRTHVDDTLCSTAPAPQPASGASPAPPPTIAGGFPTVCGGIVGMRASLPGRLRVGARNVPIGMLVATLSQMSGLGRPVIDQTGLTGTFDFTFEWTPQHTNPDVNSQGDDSGPTFQESLKQELGLELKPETGPVEVFVVDHIEMPSEN
jgi:uncharacterized protein (TIGR03435 family)